MACSVDKQKNLVFARQTPCAIDLSGSRTAFTTEAGQAPGETPGTAGRAGLPVTSAGARGPVVGQAAHRPPSHRLASAPRSEGPLHLIRGGAFRMPGHAGKAGTRCNKHLRFKVFKSAFPSECAPDPSAHFPSAIAPRVSWAAARLQCDTDRDGPRTLRYEVS
jgi:hypothetical protein